MTTIHLTDAQRDTFAACGLIVIDGEQRGSTLPHVMYQGHAYGEGWIAAPEGWRILTEPCDTCAEFAGVGVIYREKGDQENWLDGRIAEEPCPDCVGGRRVVTLTATCPICEGEGGYIVHDDQGDECRHGNCRTCGAGMEGGGVVTLGRFTIPALLPVQPPFNQRPALLVDLSSGHWWIRENGPRWLEILPGERDLELHPGQFIARPERVE